MLGRCSGTVTGISKSTVSKLCKDIDERVQAFLKRLLLPSRVPSVAIGKTMAPTAEIAPPTTSSRTSFDRQPARSGGPKWEGLCCINAFIMPRISE